MGEIWHWSVKLASLVAADVASFHEGPDTMHIVAIFCSANLILCRSLVPLWNLVRYVHGAPRSLFDARLSCSSGPGWTPGVHYLQEFGAYVRSAACSSVWTVGWSSYKTGGVQRHAHTYIWNAAYAHPCALFHAYENVKKKGTKISRRRVMKLWCLGADYRRCSFDRVSNTLHVLTSCVL